MKKQDIAEKSISELRVMAKKAGITAKSIWKKQDFIKALSKKEPSKNKTRKKTAKESKKKAPAKKTVVKKVVARESESVSKAKPKKAEEKIKEKTETQKAKAPVKTKTEVLAKLKQKTLANIKAETLKKRAAKKAAPKPVKKEVKATLDKLTVAELKTLAKELDIPLKSGFKKADIIKAISTAKVKTEKSALRKTKKAKTPKPTPAKKEKKVVKEFAAAKKPAKISEKLPEVLKGISKELAEKPTSPKEPIIQATPEGMSSLPVRYGEDKLASMPVTPGQIYVYWEITEDTISQYRGSLNLKIVNSKTNAFFYLPVSERIGEHFINVSPATEYTVEIGVINYKGEFVKILYSLPVETPASCVAPVEREGERGPQKSISAAEAGGLPEEFFETREGEGISPESISSY